MNLSTPAARLIWARRRALFVVTAATLVPVVLARSALVYGVHRRTASYVNDVVVSAPRSGLDLLAAVLLVLGWIWTVGSGVLVVAGALNGAPVTPGAAMRRAAERPFAFIRTVWLRTLLALVVAAAMAPFVMVGPTGAFAIVVVAFILGVSVLELPGIVIAGRGRETGRIPATIGTVPFAATVGVTVVGIIGCLAVDRNLVGITVPTTASPTVQMAFAAIDPIVGVIIAMVAAIVETITLTVVFVRRVERRDPATQAAAVPGDRGGTRRWPGMLIASGAAVAILVPGIATATAAATNPLRLPRVHAQVLDYADEVLAVGWPAGTEPVVAMQHRIVWCLDDACRGMRTQSIDLSARGTAAAIDADGAAVSAAPMISGGSPSIRLSRCTAGGCQNADVPWPAAGTDRHPMLAIAAQPGGELLVGTAAEFDVDHGAASGLALTLTRCADLACADPVSTAFPMSPDDVWPAPLDRSYVHHAYLPAAAILAVVVAANGLPMLALHSDASLVGTCSTVDCATPKTIRMHDSHIYANVFDVDPGPPSITEAQQGAVFTCDPKRCYTTRLTQEDGLDADAVAVDGEGFYTIASPRTGNLTRLVTLWHGIVPESHGIGPQVRNTPLGFTDDRDIESWIGVNPDGRIVAVIRDATATTLYLVPADHDRPTG